MLVAQMAVIFVLGRPLEWPAIAFVFLPVVAATTIDPLRISTSGIALGLGVPGGGVAVRTLASPLHGTTQL